MKQVVQPAGGGRPVVVEAPAPAMSTTSLLVATSATLISAGTERAATQLAQANLAQKARARPDLVKQVVQKARTDGVKATVSAVRSRLSDDLALGYSGAGTVLEVGQSVRGFRPGDRVATAGGGHASHAELQSVPMTLAALIPDGVSDEAASFATVASVGLHGLRLADTRVGGKIVVVGLGLIGQLTARIAVASGCDVFGIDLDQSLLGLAGAHGVTGCVESGADTTRAILDWSRGRGADSVIITAGARGDSGIARTAPERCRDRGTVVAVGDVGLDIDRNAFYDKELDLKVARSYGPGRYDRSYEEWGVDYPVGHVRWTEGRNLEAVLDLLAAHRLDVDDLITHRFAIDQAPAAYEALEASAERPLGVVLTYPGRVAAARTVHTGARPTRTRKRSGPSIGIIGVGNFVRGVVMPALDKAAVGPLVHVASASGVTAARFAERYGVGKASSDPTAVIDDDDVELVVIATPHSSHAELVTAALAAGKDVYCEKPLALDWEQLRSVEHALQDSDAALYVGFNRRFAPQVAEMRRRLAGSGPIRLEYRVNAGPLAPGHWYADRREGGRLHGEVCHFVDTCGFLVDDADVAQVSAVAATAEPHDSYHLFITYVDGSSASVVYSDSSHEGTPKERIEVNGRGHTLVLDNFRTLTVDGRPMRGEAGKGHAEGLAAFMSSLRGDGPPPDPASALRTTRTVLMAADQLV